MKRILLILCFLCPLLVFSQAYHLPLVKDQYSGLFYIDASLNNVKGQFIFDTGASGIVVNGNFYNRLVRNNEIQPSDYKGDVQSIIADGSVVTGKVYHIEQMTAGDLVLNDVEVTVMPQSNAGMLIGQTFLAQFGKITMDLDNSRLILDQKVPNAPKPLSLTEIRFVPCYSTQETFTNLKSVVKSTGIAVSKYTQEDKVPPTQALKRVNAKFTIRYFDRDTERLSKVISQSLQKEYPNLAIFTEDMRPYFGGSNIPEYIEIWIK